MRAELDDYNAKFESLLRAENQLIGRYGVFDEKLPQKMKTLSNGQLTIKLGGDFEPSIHTTPTTAFLNSFEDDLFSANSPDELRDNLHKQGPGSNLVFKLDATNDEWPEIIFECVSSDPAQQWKQLRDDIRNDAQLLEPKLRSKLPGWRQKLGL